MKSAVAKGDLGKSGGAFGQGEAETAVDFEALTDWRVARNTLVQLAGRALTTTLSFASLMLLARSLGPDGIGNYLLVISLLMLLNLSDMGFTTIALRELSLSQDRSVFMGNLLLIRVVLALLAMAVVSTAALLLNYNTQLTYALILGSVSYLFTAIGQGSFGIIFAADLRMEYQALANAIQGVSFLILAAIVLVMNGGVVAIVLAYDGGVLAGAVAIWWFSRRFARVRFRPNLSLCRHLAADSLPVAMAFGFWLAYNRIDMVLISKMAGPHSLGLYGMAYRFVDLAWPIGLYFSLSVYPVLTRLFHSGDKEQTLRLAQRSLNALTLVVIPAATILFIFAEPILELIGGRAFRPAAWALRWLTFAIVATWLSGLTSHLLMAMGKQGVLFRVLPFALVANVGLNLLMIPRFDFEAAAANTALTEVIVLVYGMFLLKRLGYLPSFVLPVKVGLTGAVCAAFALLLLPDILPVRALLVPVIFVTIALLLRVFNVQDLQRLCEYAAQRISQSLSEYRVRRNAIPAVGPIGETDS